MREFELVGTFLRAGVLECDPDALRRCASGRLLAVSLGTGVERFDLAQLLAELVLGYHGRQCTVGFSVRLPSIILRRARVQEYTAHLIAVSMLLVSTRTWLTDVPRLSASSATGSTTERRTGQ